MRGFLRKVKKVTPSTAFTKIREFFGKTLDKTSLTQLEETLYAADFGVETTAAIMAKIQTAYRQNTTLHGQEAAQIGAEVLQKMLISAEKSLILGEERPQVICLIGVNGSGKTTTAAKLAYHLQTQGKRIILGACDTFRAAANEQLSVWADRLNLDIIRSHRGADPAAVAFDSYEAAKSRGHQIVILDTAGRLHNKENLLGELGKIRRALQKHDPKAPHHRWLVIDGSLGSNSIEQARVFHKAFELTGLILTKLDGTSRGGALVGIHRELQLPIYFVGLGEAVDALQPFRIEAYLSSIFGTHAEMYCQ